MNLVVGKMGLRHSLGRSCETGNGRHKGGGCLEGFYEIGNA